MAANKEFRARKEITKAALCQRSCTDRDPGYRTTLHGEPCRGEMVVRDNDGDNLLESAELAGDSTFGGPEWDTFLLQSEWISRVRVSECVIHLPFTRCEKW